MGKTKTGIQENDGLDLEEKDVELRLDQPMIYYSFLIKPSGVRCCWWNWNVR